MLMFGIQTTNEYRSTLRLRSRWRSVAVAGAGALLLVSACVNVVQQNAPGALQTAESRARFELNCPAVQASILSQKVVQGWRFEGSEHTIGVRGCGREAVYTTYCSDATDCNAISQTGRINTLSTLAPSGMVP
jgi:hypothetical protein